MGSRWIWTVATLAVATAISLSADPQAVVTEAKGIYTVRAKFTVPQSPEAAMAVLTDYELLPRFMPDLKNSSVIARTGARVTVAQEAVASFFPFSKHIYLTLEIDEMPHALAFKDRSGKSFSQYNGTWQVSKVEGRTVVVYTLVAKPSFSVPEFLLTKLLKRDAGRMITALQAEIAARR